MRANTDLSYIHQEHLTGTAVVSDGSGASTGTMKYFPFGTTRSGSVSTDKKFTGQRLDSTGLYYYGARYYDAGIGRFISADTIVPDFTNPQSFNRYSYCFNNPLRYTDPTGHWSWGDLWGSVKNFVSSITSSVTSTVKSGWNNVVSTTKPMYETAVNKVSSGWNTCINTAQTVKSTAIQYGVSAYKAAPGYIYAGYHAAVASIGVEGTSPLNTSLVSDVPAIDVRQGSLLDTMLPDNPVTLYPVGIFTNTPMRPAIQEEEGFHWVQESQYGPFVGLYYRQYVREYSLNLVAYGFNTTLSHNAVSFERSAMAYAKTGPPPPPPWEYWLNKILR